MTVIGRFATVPQSFALLAPLISLSDVCPHPDEARGVARPRSASRVESR
jgi:hypothetical protein